MTVNGGGGGATGGGDLETLKQEILTEMRKEMKQMKIDIIEGWYTVIHFWRVAAKMLDNVQKVFFKSAYIL